MLRNGVPLCPPTSRMALALRVFSDIQSVICGPQSRRTCDVSSVPMRGQSGIDRIQWETAASSMAEPAALGRVVSGCVPVGDLGFEVRRATRPTGRLTDTRRVQRGALAGCRIEPGAFWVCPHPVGGQPCAPGTGNLAAGEAIDGSPGQRPINSRIGGSLTARARRPRPTLPTSRDRIRACLDVLG
jgi:hypothetical protein